MSGLLDATLIAAVAILAWLVVRLARQNRLWCARFTLAAVGLAQVDTRTERFGRSNAALCRMLGYSAGELRGLTFTQVTHPDDRWIGREQFIRMIHGELDGFRLEKRYLRKDGGILWANVAITPLRHRGGRVTAALAVVIDVTDARRAEEALRESEETHRGLYNESPAMVHSIDASGRITHVSNLWLRTLGYRRDEVLGRKSVDFLTPDSRRYAEEVVLPAYFALGTCWDVPYQFVKKCGERMDVLLSASSERDRDGRFVRSLAVLVDVTARKRLEAERDRLLAHERDARLDAQRSVHARDDFIAIASHELRTPLTPLKLYLQVLEAAVGKLGDACARELAPFSKAFERCDRQVARLTRLVDDLLDVSRITAGRLVLERAPVELGELVRAAIESCRVQLDAAECRVSLDAAGGVSGTWDRARVEQVVINLLTNAAKYGARAPIDVAVDQRGRMARLRVCDHGIGISKEQQRRIFERFERAATIRRYGGLGLGLFIAREIVAAHGGTIAVESEPGRGATFIVELPVEERASLPASSAHPS